MRSAIPWTPSKIAFLILKSWFERRHPSFRHSTYFGKLNFIFSSPNANSLATLDSGTDERGVSQLGSPDIFSLTNNLIAAHELPSALIEETATVKMGFERGRINLGHGMPGELRAEVTLPEEVDTPPGTLFQYGNAITQPPPLLITRKSSPASSIETMPASQTATEAQHNGNEVQAHEVEGSPNPAASPKNGLVVGNAAGMETPLANFQDATGQRATGSEDFQDFALAAPNGNSALSASTADDGFVDHSMHERRRVALDMADRSIEGIPKVIAGKGAVGYDALDDGATQFRCDESKVVGSMAHQSNPAPGSESMF